MTVPCKGCPERHEACHDHCARFAAWREQHKAEMQYNAICHELESIGRHDYDKESWMGGKRPPRKRRKS